MLSSGLGGDTQKNAPASPFRSQDSRRQLCRGCRCPWPRRLGDPNAATSCGTREPARHPFPWRLSSRLVAANGERAGIRFPRILRAQHPQPEHAPGLLPSTVSESARLGRLVPICLPGRMEAESVWQNIGWTSSNRAVSRVIPPPCCGDVAIYTLLTMLPQKLRPRICIAVMHLSGI